MAQRLALALAGGDDYELLFSAPPAARETIPALAARAGHPWPPTRIGALVAEPGIRLLADDGTTIAVDGLASFDHFR